MDEGLQVLVPLMNYSYYYCGNNGFRLYHPVGGNLEVPVSLHEQAVVSEQDILRLRPCSSSSPSHQLSVTVIVSVSFT